MNSPKLQGLDAFADLTRERLDHKSNLLRVLTAFYIQKPQHSADEERHFVDLAVGLIDEADARTRAAVLAKLTEYGNAPAEVLERLAGSKKIPAQLASPATTADGHAAKPAVLPAHNDVEAATGFTDLFFSADAATRRVMLREVGAQATATLPSPDDAAGAVRRLEAAALAGRPFEFVREIEHALTLGRRQAERVVNDRSGEPMLVIAKALDMPVEVLQRVLLLVNPSVGMSVRRVFDLSALYRDITQQAALRMLALWRHARADAPQQPERQPAAGAGRDPRSEPRVAHDAPAFRPVRDQFAS